ncbi:sulfotransferase [candidate division KSB3 bacterium]|uniref:Sulfotransferase n=1 Tax=candidate division KSB3 bacterium TaxID=2044937 RepID=A0A9D5JZM1_9BACT|nr:sulfotransferase [candidate division KSB3 bacterium]MBD3327212.1 sulfotransferase [candidate division KSB3 bacterium]
MRKCLPSPREGVEPMHPKLKHLIITFFNRVLVQDEVKRTLVDTLSTPFSHRSHILEHVSNDVTTQPYPDLGAITGTEQASERQDIIFITGRFRSGSTLLWNIFRSIPGITAYYEPLNESSQKRRFTSRHQKNAKHEQTMAQKMRHTLVEDYDQEYQGLESLAALYQETWIRNALYMDAGAYNPQMKQFITLLIEHAPGRPVLQFNRIDFRLPWIRQNFPHAKLLHIYRHPREQWCSSLLVHSSSFSPDGRMEDFAPYDGFYLRMWAQDLKYHFPFLDERRVTHPYELFYYLWKLSWLFGTAYSDVSICFEELLQRPSQILTLLFEELQLEREHVARAEQLIVKPRLDKWKDYADEAWFVQKESQCEAVLHEFWITQKPGPNSPRKYSTEPLKNLDMGKF